MKFLFIEWGVIRVITYEKYFGCNWIAIVVLGVEVSVKLKV